MEYELRELKTSDIFAMSKIIKKMNLKIELNNIDFKKNADEVKTKAGLSFIKEVLENLHIAQNEINDFMGSMVGITGEEFGKLPIMESFQIIKKFKSIPGLEGFFKLAGQLTK